MSSQEVSTGMIARSVAIRVLAGFAVVTVLLTIFIMMGLGGAAPQRTADFHLSQAHLHAPNWALLAEASLAMKIHLATVLAALLLATVQMVGPKGRTLHRVMGWTLAVLLVTTSVASLFIRNQGGGLINPFQVFSIWTLIAVPWGIWAARRHNVRRHASMMAGLYFGGMVLAGLLTFIPGRLMWRLFFG